MWKSIITSLFKEANFYVQVLEQSYTMLDMDLSMYEASVTSLRQSDTGELELDVYQLDEQINAYEQEVRKKIMTHLALTGGHDLAPGLVLVSVVIDIERIGDYTKNIAGLAKLHPERLKGGTNEESLAAVESTIAANFPAVIEVMSTYDRETARKVMQREPDAARASDQIVNDMIIGRDANLSRGESVSLATRHAVHFKPGRELRLRVDAVSRW